MSEGPEAAYFRYLEQGDWRIQQCARCRQFVHVPRVLCPHCGSDALAWMQPKGTGRIYSFTVVHAPSDPEERYNVALIDLDEGVRLMSTVTGLGDRGPEIGERVRALVVDAPSGAGKLLVFESAGDDR